MCWTLKYLSQPHPLIVKFTPDERSKKFEIRESNQALAQMSADRMLRIFTDTVEGLL